MTVLMWIVKLITAVIIATSAWFTLNNLNDDYTEPGRNYDPIFIVDPHINTKPYKLTTPESLELCKAGYKHNC